MIRVLREELVAHLGLVDGDEPYVTPISFVQMGDAIYLRTGPGRRLEVIRSRPHVCVEASRHVNDRGDWESVLVWGEADVLGAGDEADEAIGMLLYKYRAVFASSAAFAGPSPLAPGEVVVKIPIGRMTGRRSAAGFGVSIRPGRL
jgi:nitroimidazol reductase NimA-like FMN-containing flavoprotein (pyridoxamine 5'-phosphate oxidase superfamily)